MFRENIKYVVLSVKRYLSPEAGSSFRCSPRGPLWISFGFIFWKFSPPTEKSFILTEGRKDGRTILKSRKNMVFGNISKSTQYFFLIVSGPHRRLLKTSFGSFRIGKIGNFSTQKSPNNILWKSRKKPTFQEYLKNYSIFFSDCFWSPQKSFEDISWNFPNWKNRKIFHLKIA